MARQVFPKDLQQSCNDEITYHVMKADRSVTRRDFNYLYSQFTKEQFAGKNGEMFQRRNVPKTICIDLLKTLIRMLYFKYRCISKVSGVWW